MLVFVCAGPSPGPRIYYKITSVTLYLIRIAFVLLLSPAFAHAEQCKNDYFGFYLAAPDGWYSEKILWQGEKSPALKDSYPPQVVSGLPPKLTEWSGKELGCKFSGPEGDVFVRATTAPAPEQLPFQEYNGEFDMPAPAEAFERLVSSEVFVSSYGARGVAAVRGPAGPAGATARVYYFPLQEPRKLWEMRMLSVIIFVHPARGQGAQALVVLDKTAASFAFYGGAGSEYDEDDDRKLFPASRGSVYYLRLPLKGGFSWRVYSAQADRLRVNNLPSADEVAQWELVPLALGRTELVLRLYDGTQEAVREFSLRFKVNQ